MEIGGLQKSTLIDYPGHIACTVFLVGCNFRCPWCYSPEIVLPDMINRQPKISQEELFNFLKKRKGLIDGVVICGGEPTINNDLPDFIKKIKKIGYLVKLDTNGSNPEILKKLIDEKLIDYIAMDIKAPFSVKNKNQKYNKTTGVNIDLNKIKKSIEIIKNSGIEYEFRTTVVPGIHSQEDILQISKEISPAKKYFLQNFKLKKTIGSEFEKTKPCSAEFLLAIQKEISPFFEICQVR